MFNEELVGPSSVVRTMRAIGYLCSDCRDGRAISLSCRLHGVLSRTKACRSSSQRTDGHDVLAQANWHTTSSVYGHMHPLPSFCWRKKTRAPPQHDGDAGVYCQVTTSMHDLSVSTAPSPIPLHHICQPSCVSHSHRFMYSPPPSCRRKDQRRLLRVPHARDHEGTPGGVQEGREAGDGPVGQFAAQRTSQLRG